MESTTVQKTPLYELHKNAGAKLIEFGGWLMPVSYSGVLAEHKNVREACGLFDVSHMGEIRISGPDAERFIQHVTVNDVAKLKNLRGQYTALLKPTGGMIDDLILYRLSDEDFLLCVNASNSAKDHAWLVSQSGSFDVSVRDESTDWAQIAVQGPTSSAALQAIADDDTNQALAELKYASICHAVLDGHECLVARTGYTGEHGYEIYLKPGHAGSIWQALMHTAPRTGILPTGLGARDTLRLEACYLLYGNDMNENISPLEAGISWAVKMSKPDFIGKAALERQIADGLKQKIVAFKMQNDGIPRHGMTVYWQGEPAGYVTSGSVLPTLGGAGGMAMVNPSVCENDELEIDVRGNKKLALCQKRPLYLAKTK